MGPVRFLLLLLRDVFRDRASLAAENLALRQQLAALQHKSRRPRLRKRDRIFWALLSRVWPNWRSALLIVQPETVVGWHRMGFKLFWRRKSRAGKVGRPKIEAEIRQLIRRMSSENPTWGGVSSKGWRVEIGMQSGPTSASKRDPPGSVEYPLEEGVQGLLLRV